MTRFSNKCQYALWFSLAFVFFVPWVWSVWVCGRHHQTGRASWLARLLIAQDWWGYFVWISVVIGACCIGGTATALILTFRSRPAADQRAADS